MRTLAQLSGGFDSVAATLEVAKSGERFSTVFFNIGQPYLEQELAAVEYVTTFLKNNFENYKVHYYVQLPVFFNAVDDSVPKEYIPVRNLVLGSSSINMAIAEGYDTIAVGNKTIAVRPDDPYSFADCSIEFYSMLGALGTFASQGKNIVFSMPLVELRNGVPVALTKEQVIGIVADAGLDVKKIWSCYTPGDKYCGTCYHCQEIKKTAYADLFFE